jgi:hypothetical protein
MLVIRKDQIQHFIAANDEELIKLIAEAVRAGTAARVNEHDDETLQAMVKRGVGRARTRKFDRAEDIAAFVGIMFEIAPNFDENDEVKAILGDENFPPEERFKQLFGKTSDELWQKLEEKYDARVWFE